MKTDRDDASDFTPHRTLANVLGDCSATKPVGETWSFYFNIYYSVIEDNTTDPDLSQKWIASGTINSVSTS